MHKRIMAAVVTAWMVLLLVVQPALAMSPSAQQRDQRYGLTCVDGVCRAELDLGLGAAWLPQGAWLSVMQSALRQLPGKAEIALEDEVTITLPTGNLSLADADLVITLDEMGKIAALRGSAAAPVPTFGLLGDWQVVTPARVTVGYDRGAALAELDAPLQAERRYFFVDAQAGLHLATQGMALSAPAGQRATIIMDLAQPLVFIDGQVTLHTDGQMAFIREALGPIGESGWLPTDLPLHQSVLVHVQGQLGRDIEPKLTLAGEYRMDGGLVGKWLQVDATPLLAQGQAVIGPAGLMLSGSARSALEPQKWFDSGAQAQLFVPFDAPDGSSVTVGADVASPALGVEQEATATVAGEAGWLARTGEAAWSGMQQGWSQAGTVAQSGYAWMGKGFGTGWAYTQEQWCGLTGLCPDEVATTREEGTRVAAAE
ncbi:MAG: hypothetical protein IT328_25115 [Caldilineaceae bacterium]|nr:hypothetical protein [Caldilineaceae bacterium]